ncbi:MAG: hypothetical protein FLDDKLPJ_03748 [Phycisphaerae bacterium]|nr:hypothetical protein [Phycisphaerae bacterium]
MGLLWNLFCGVSHFGLVGLDVLAFFLTARLLALGSTMKAAHAVDGVGTPWVDALLNYAARRLRLSQVNSKRAQGVLGGLLLLTVGVLRGIVAALVP